MKILFCSNYSSNSAYAIQAKLLVPRIQSLGHTVKVLELTAGRSVAHTIDGVDILPLGKDNFGADVILEYVRRGGYHAVMSLIDPWGMNPEVMKHVAWFPLSPIDTQPVSPRNVAALAACVRPIALTKWGAGELRTVGLNPLYLPHGFEPSIWHPMDRLQARTSLGIPSHVFMASFVGVNDSLPSRKGIAELLFAWQAFRQEHEDVLLYLHTDPQGNIPEAGDKGGVDILTQLLSLHMPEDAIKMVDTFRYRTNAIPASELAAVAAASDVLVLPGKGEGFGVPIIEFAAAGTPAIVTKFGSMAELADSCGGMLVRFDPDWGWQNAMTARVLIGDLLSALETAYEERGTPKAVERRQAALTGAQAYNINRVFMEHGIGVMDAMTQATLEAVR